MISGAGDERYTWGERQKFRQWQKPLERLGGENHRGEGHVHLDRSSFWGVLSNEAGE